MNLSKTSNEPSPVWSEVGTLKKIFINLRNVLGGGGFGKVFGGKYEGRDVAVKRMDKSLLPNPLPERYQSECDMVRAFDNHNVIKYLFHDVDVENMYIVLELCECPLSRYIKRKENVKMDPCKSYIIMYKATAGLAYLHNKGILHRDVKLSNFLLAKNGEKFEVKITDFGISKTLDLGKTSTQATLAGTCGYKATEILRGAEVRAASDIFSLGIVFHELLTGGKHPFGQDQLDRDPSIRDKKEPYLNRIKHHGLRKLIAKMIDHDSNVRPTADEVQVNLISLFAEVFSVHFPYRMSADDKMKRVIGFLIEPFSNERNLRDLCEYIRKVEENESLELTSESSDSPTPEELTADVSDEDDDDDDDVIFVGTIVPPRSKQSNMMSVKEEYAVHAARTTGGTQSTLCKQENLQEQRLITTLFGDSCETEDTNEVKSSHEPSTKSSENVAAREVPTEREKIPIIQPFVRNAEKYLVNSECAFGHASPNEIPRVQSPEMTRINRIFPEVKPDHCRKRNKSNDSQPEISKIYRIFPGGKPEQTRERKSSKDYNREAPDKNRLPEQNRERKLSKEINRGIPEKKREIPEQIREGKLSKEIHRGILEKKREIPKQNRERKLSKEIHRGIPEKEREIPEQNRERKLSKEIYRKISGTKLEPIRERQSSKEVHNHQKKSVNHAIEDKSEEKPKQKSDAPFKRLGESSQTESNDKRRKISSEIATFPRGRDARAAVSKHRSKSKNEPSSKESEKHLSLIKGNIERKSSFESAGNDRIKSRNIETAYGRKCSSENARKTSSEHSPRRENLKRSPSYVPTQEAAKHLKAKSENVREPKLNPKTSHKSDKRKNESKIAMKKNKGGEEESSEENKVWQACTATTSCGKIFPPPKKIKLTQQEKESLAKHKQDDEFRKYAHKGKWKEVKSEYLQYHDQIKLELLASESAFKKGCTMRDRLFQQLLTNWAKPRPHASVVYELAEACVQDPDAQIRGVLLFACASALYKLDLRPNKACDGMLNCMTMISVTYGQMRNTANYDADNARDFVISTLNDTYNVVRELTNISHLKFSKRKASCCGCLSSSYNDVGDFQNAVKIGKKGMKLLKNLALYNPFKNPTYAFLLENVARAYAGLGDKETSKMYFKQAKQALLEKESDSEDDS